MNLLIIQQIVVCLRILNINFSSSYDFLDDFQVSASGRYDLLGNQMATTSFGYGFSVGSWDYNFTQEYLKEEREKFSISAIYDDECTRLTFSFENRYQDVGSSGPVKSHASCPIKAFCKCCIFPGW